MVAKEGLLYFILLCYMCNRMPDMFAIQNDLKQEDALMLLLFNFALHMPLGRSRETKWDCNLNGIHQLSVTADDVNVLGDKLHNTKTPINTSKEVDLEVNADKTKCIVQSHHQNARRNHDVRTVNRLFEIVHSSDIF
jgi:hypothetical protein